jgi:hypothetical protein
MSRIQVAASLPAKAAQGATEAVEAERLAGAAKDAGAKSPSENPLVGAKGTEGVKDKSLKKGRKAEGPDTLQKLYRKAASVRAKKGTKSLPCSKVCKSMKLTRTGTR